MWKGDKTGYKKKLNLRQCVTFIGLLYPETFSQSFQGFFTTVNGKNLSKADIHSLSFSG